MSLREEIELYSKLTGKDGTREPIVRIGAYLDGYEKGKAFAQPEIIYCRDCKYGIRDSSFPYQWFCKFKGDEWNNGDYFCGHARKREVTE